MQTRIEALYKLSQSKFRSSFHLKEKDKLYVEEKGMDVIRRHACDFVRNKLADSYPKNDGKQTPMKGHPVFIAMHACACCCRGCLNRWYHVEKGITLTDRDSTYKRHKYANICTSNLYFCLYLQTLADTFW